MKKLVVIMALAATLAGCGMQHERVVEMKKRCHAIGGETVYIQNPNGTVEVVRCVVDGITYRMGDY